MKAFRHQLWKWVDGALFTAVLVLFALLLYYRYGKIGAQFSFFNQASPHDKAVLTPASGVKDPKEPMLRRPVAVPNSIRPIGWGGATSAHDTRLQWSEQGVRDVEWDKLPPSPGLDMIQAARGYVVVFSLPNVLNEDILIGCANGSLDIKAIIRDTLGNVQGQAFRRIRLPSDSVADGGFERVFSNGVLRVFIPRVL